MAVNDPAAGKTPDHQPETARHVFGLILLILGVLLTGGSGLCTGVLTVAFLADGGGGPELSGDDLWMLPLIFGGPFVIIGALMWWGGWALRRKRSPSTVPPPPRT